MNSDKCINKNSPDGQKLSGGICYIVAAGDRKRLDFIPAPGDYVIAADAGIRYLQEAGIRVDLALGDFDSLGSIPDKSCCSEIRKLNVIKDDTDTQAAVSIGLQKGYRFFCIYCATGGKRIDHTIANIQTLIFLSENNAHGIMFDGENAITVIHNEGVDFTAQENAYFSVFAVNGKAQGVSIRGFMYELKDAELCPSFPLGVSNQFIGKPGHVEVRKGSLLLVYPSTQDPYCLKVQNQ